MKAYLFSFGLGCVVGLLYGLCRVKSPAPPIIALLGLLGMVLGESGYTWWKTFIHSPERGCIHVQRNCFRATHRPCRDHRP